MSYIHINNLYRVPEFLDIFKNVWVLEKIDGTTGSITLSPEGFHLHSGGAEYEKAKSLFDEEFLLNKYKEMANDCTYKIHGEFYGSKIQGLSKTYGPNLKFIGFDVKFSKDDKHEHWMNVPEAANFCLNLGLEFVEFTQVNNSLEKLNEFRDASSTQASRNGMGEDKLREGIVIRPVRECYDQWGDRWIIKHKQDRVRETKTKREVTSEELQVLTDAQEIASEWVTHERLGHILSKDSKVWDISDTGNIIRLMIDDIKRESAGEVVWSKTVEKEIGKHTAQLYKKHIYEDVQL